MKFKSILLAAIYIVVCTQFVTAQNSNSITELEIQKAKAVEDQNYSLAADLNTKIKELKEKQAAERLAREAAQKRKAARASELALLEKQKAAAVTNQDYTLAAEISKKIKKANEIELLEKEKATAVANQDYELANTLKIKIAKLTEVEDLEWQKKEAVANQDYALAGELNKKIIALKEDKPAVTQQTAASTNTTASSGYTQIAGSANPSSNSVVYTKTEKSKIRHSDDNAATGLNYRRSSLYTMMLLDPNREHAHTIARSFVDFPLPGKFNDHDLNDKVIQSSSGSDPLSVITQYVNTNAIAREIVAKWFNRNSKGAFNMDLIASRGNYNASVSDLKIAANSARGNALLSDAGEDLISNTFIVINDFKYTNKEEVAKKTNAGLSILGAGLEMAGVSNASTYTTVAQAGVTVAGKGYIIKNTSYLFRLVWNEEVAAQFYQNYWIDDASFDAAKKAAFDNSNLFTLRYVGQESAWADLQSSALTSKSDEQLIATATLKAINSGVAKLQRKFEEFRTRTPIYTTNPTTARIGMKEGVEVGDNFEVLEAVQELGGKVTYVRKGIIKAISVWDNRYDVSEMGQDAAQIQNAGMTGSMQGMEVIGGLLNAQGQNQGIVAGTRNVQGQTTGNGGQYTIFKGPENVFFPGMLIRQIN